MKNLIFIIIEIILFVCGIISLKNEIDSEVRNLNGKYKKIHGKNIKLNNNQDVVDLDVFLKDKIAIMNQNYKVIGPSCIPLISKSIYSNPYHPSLLSKPNAQIRYGHGLPTPLPINSVDCPSDLAGPCSLTLSKAFSLTVSDSYAISFGDSKQFSKSISNGISNGAANSKSNVIGQTIDKSILQNDLNFTNDESLINSINNSIRKSFESQSSVLKNRSKMPEINYIIQNKNQIKNKTFSTLHGFDDQFEKNHLKNFKIRNLRAIISPIRDVSIDFGRANARTGPMSNMIDFDSNIDSISVSRNSNLLRDDTETSDEDLNQNNLKIDKSSSFSNESGISNTLSEQAQNGDSKSYSKEKSITKIKILTAEELYLIAPGTCKTGVYVPSILDIAIPFECYENHKAELVVVNHMFINKKAHEQPTISLIDCIKQENDAKMFKIDNFEYLTANLNNSFEHGQIGYINKFKIISQNGKFTLSLMYNGNLELRLHDKVIWENKMGYFRNYTGIRLRINEKGHLIEEVKGLFSKTAPSFRKNEWITVWSSAPIEHNTTIGIPYVINQYITYKLILENTGELNLYDAVGALIWCISKDCLHRYGYKFPEIYMVPINFKTETDFLLTDMDNHIDKNIMILKRSTLNSLDINCETLKQNEALISPNKRFKLILEPSGNLIIKDGTRTMWSSSSGNLIFTRPPYELLLTPTGSLLIIDVNKYIIWASNFNFNIHSKYDKSFKLSLLDQGNLIVKDKKGTILWDSWPTNQMYKGVNFLRPIKYKYIPCHKKEIFGLYLGCYKDDPNSRDMHEANYLYLEDNTLEKCFYFCSQKRFRYAGLQYGSDCWCSNTYGKYGKSKNCDSVCPGDPNEICGGNMVNSIYDVNANLNESSEKSIEFKKKI